MPYISCIVLLFFCWLPFSYAQMPVLDQAGLERIAEAEGYGYKYANLKMLEALTIWFNKKNHAYKVAIPQYFGIPSTKQQDFLQAHHVDMRGRWSKLIASYLLGQKAKILSEKQYPRAFLSEQEKFEHQLLSDFNAIIDRADPGTSLDNIFHVPGIDALLKDVSAKNERLMVRSSGKEDTKKLANAGGNESRANVLPVPKDVLNALRDVVVSYFGQKSLKQRLGAGDESIFDNKPFTPVIMQRMIGEKTPDALPKCGVMFTEEAEGGVARYAQRDKNNNVVGKLKTTGITIVQSAYGHNEGVVNSIIPVDTYYIDNSDTIYPIIRPKIHRMMPDPDKAGSLKLVQNNESVVHKPALSRDALKTLKAFAKGLERYYNDAMDVEFVVNETEKTIYIVQARPIVHKTGLLPASYITNPEQLLGENKVAGETIGVAGGSLRLITERKQIIVEKNIGDALAIYHNQESTPDTKIIESIIVGKTAPATSHEATAFRSEGKPVIYLEQWQAIKDWLKRYNVLVASPQQGMVAKWTGGENSIAAMIQNKAASQGWINYPVPLLLSLSPQFADRPDKNFDDIILSLLPYGKTVESFSKKAFELEDFRSSINVLKQGTREQAEIALAEILFALRFIVKKAHGSQKGTLDDSYRRRVSLLFIYAATIAQRIKPHLDAGPDNKQEYPARLFPIRMLESVLFQKPRLGTIEDGMFSLERIIRGLTEERVIRETQAITDPMTIKLIGFSKLTKTHNLKKSWESFIKDFMATADARTKEEMITIIQEIGALDALPIWLHTSFVKAGRDAQHDAKFIAQKIISDFKADGELIAKISQKSQQIKGFNIGVFDNPKNFTTSWQTLHHDILAYFLSADFQASFVASGNLGRMMSIRVLAKLVNEVFDLSIKAVTGSQLYSEEQKIENLKVMLPQFNKLLYAVINLQKILPRQLDTYPLRFIAPVLNRNNFTPLDLRATPGFKVSLFTIGNGVTDGTYARMTDVKPHTLEDAFTLIHQNILVVLGALTASFGIENIERPEVLKTVESALQNIKTERSSKPFLMSADVSNNAITLVYNLPLQTHSGQFELIYNDRSNSVTIKARFFGDARDRWSTMAQFIRFFVFPGLLEYSNIEISNDQVVFDLAIGHTISEDIIKNIFDTCSNITFSNDLNYMDSSFYNEIIRLFKNPEDRGKVYKIILENTSKILQSYGYNKQAADILEALVAKPTFDWVTQKVMAIANQTKDPTLKLRLLKKLVLEGEHPLGIDDIGFEKIDWTENRRYLGVELIRAQIKANNTIVIEKALHFIDQKMLENQCKEYSPCMELFEALLEEKNQVAAQKYLTLLLSRIRNKEFSFHDQNITENMLKIGDDFIIMQVFNSALSLLKSKDKKDREIGISLASIFILLDMNIDDLEVIMFDLCKDEKTAAVGLQLLSQSASRRIYNSANHDLFLKAFSVGAQLMASDVQAIVDKATNLINTIKSKWPAETITNLFSLPYKMMASDRTQDQEAAVRIVQRLLEKNPLIPEYLFDSTLNFAITSLGLLDEDLLEFSRGLLVKLLNLDYVTNGKIRKICQKFLDDAELSLTTIKTDAEIKKHSALITLALISMDNAQQNRAVALIEKFNSQYQAQVGFILRSLLNNADFVGSIKEKYVPLLKQLAQVQ